MNVRSAINNGLFAKQQPEPFYTCPTGNCTFKESYSSVAYCSFCTDISSELKFFNYSKYEGWEYKYTNISISTPSHTVTLSRMTEWNATWGATDRTDLVSHGWRNVTIIRWDVGTEHESKAYSCSLAPCVKTYTANVSGGRLEEHLIKEVHDSPHIWNDDYTFSMADLDCLDNPQEQRGVLKKLGYQFNDTTRWLQYNVSFAYDDSKPTRLTLDEDLYSFSPCLKAPANENRDICNGNQTTQKALETIPIKCVYSIDYSTMYSLEYSFFYQMFTGELESSSEGGDPYKGSDTLMAIYNAGSGNGTLKDVQGIMRRVTDAITTHIRQKGLMGSDEFAMGEMHQYTTCVSVRWEWLSYAAAMVGLLVIFFACTVVSARIEQSSSPGSVSIPYDFKSSVLPILFNGFDDESMKSESVVSTLNRRKDLQKKPEEIWVTVVRKEQGLKMTVVTE